MTSNCITKFAQSWPASVSLSSIYLGLQVHFQTHSITASKYITTGTWLQCPAMEIVEGSEPIINTPLHLWQHLKGIHEKQQFKLEDYMKRVSRCDRVLSHDKPQTLCGSVKAWQECMVPSAGKDRVCISYNEIMSIYPWVSQIYTPHCSVHLWYPCISVCSSSASLGHTEWQWCIPWFSQLESAGAAPIALVYCL